MSQRNSCAFPYVWPLWQPRLGCSEGPLSWLRASLSCGLLCHLYVGMCWLLSAIHVALRLFVLLVRWHCILAVSFLSAFSSLSLFFLPLLSVSLSALFFSFLCFPSSSLVCSSCSFPPPPFSPSVFFLPSWPAFVSLAFFSWLKWNASATSIC